MVHKSNQINDIIRHFNMPVLDRQEEKSYSIQVGLDQNALFRCTEITAEWKLFQFFQMPKIILCITNKHKTLLYYKQLKEISVIQISVWWFQGWFWQMYTEITAIVQFSN